MQPSPYQLQIDIDGLRALHTFSGQWRIWKASGRAAGWRVRMRPSFTKGHAHVTVTMPRPLPLTTRILLAAVLGDDIKRALLNYVRAVRRSRIPVAFFEKRTR